MVTGDGSTPVILSPKDPPIDWKLYQAVEIRMSAQGGNEVKIKIGSFEAKQTLGPAGQYNVYHFDVNVDAPKGSRTLAIMPTDSFNDVAAIRSIRLIPRPAEFPQPTGRQPLGKRDEYRNTLYAHSPSVIEFPVTVPQGGRLHFGVGTTAKNTPVRFRVSVNGSQSDLWSKTLNDVDQWDDADSRVLRWTFWCQANRRADAVRKIDR